MSAPGGEEDKPVVWIVTHARKGADGTSVDGISGSAQRAASYGGVSRYPYCESAVAPEPTRPPLCPYCGNRHPTDRGCDGSSRRVPVQAWGFQ